MVVDFESSTDRSGGADALYAAMIATLARRAGLRPFTAAGVARVVEHGARVVGDAGKLWLGLDGLSDLLKEANHFAAASGRAAVDVTDVERAIDARIYRSAQPRERLQEDIARGTIAITTRRQRRRVLRCRRPPRG